MLFARKINNSAWFIGPSLDSDAVSELGTSEHTLSVWRVPDDKANIDDIALALALSRDKIDEMYIVFLDLKEIQKKYNWEIELQPQEGATRYVSMRNEHVNFMVNTFWEQGYLAEHIKALLSDESNYVYYDVLTLQDLLYDAVAKGSILRTDIKDAGKWKKCLNEMEKVRGYLA